MVMEGKKNSPCSCMNLAGVKSVRLKRDPLDLLTIINIGGVKPTNDGTKETGTSILV